MESVIYLIRSNYPELANMPRKIRRGVVERVCDNPMSQNPSLGCVVWCCSVIVLAVFGLCIYLRMHEGTAIIVATLIMLPFAVIGTVLKYQKDRKQFLDWLLENSHNGRPHYCLMCWQPLSDTETKSCLLCGERVYLFAADPTGTPPPEAGTQEDKAQFHLPALDLPSKEERLSISHFLQRKPNPYELGWGCLAELLMYPTGFGLFVVGYAIYDGSITWWMLPIELVLITLFIGALKKACSHEHSDIKSMVEKYCPDGVIAWCIYCDYDLRGHATASCPECGKPIFVYNFKWRPWRRKRSRPMK